MAKQTWLLRWVVGRGRAGSGSRRWLREGTRWRHAPGRRRRWARSLAQHRDPRVPVGGGHCIQRESSAIADRCDVELEVARVATRGDCPTAQLDAARWLAVALLLVVGEHALIEHKIALVKLCDSISESALTVLAARLFRQPSGLEDRA